MLSRIAVKRPVTTLMGVLIIVALGFLSISKLKMDLMPSINVPIAVVMTSYSGAAPTEIEELVTKPLEAVLGSVANMKNITSETSNGSSLIIIEFEDGTDLDFASLDIREKLDLIKGALPDGSNDPVLFKIDPNAMNSFTASISSDTLNLNELKTLVDTKLAPRLERREGVASVDVSGGLTTEIKIDLIDYKMKGYGILESSIIQLLAAENQTSSTGTIKQGDKTLGLKVDGIFTTLEDIKNLPVSTSAGNFVLLQEIATISEQYKETTSISYINGIPNIVLTLQKQSTANVVDVSDKILLELKAIQTEFPNLKVDIVTDPADFIRSTISMVSQSAIAGGILAVIVLLIFLGNFRSTVIISISIPVSIIGTFVLMYYSNLTINIMTLGGLALGVGMLVDNSVVVIESIFRKIENGEDLFVACVEGTQEVGLSIMASTFTTVAVFLPITFTGGMISMLFTELALTVTYSLLASLLVALTFVPMAVAVLLKTDLKQPKIFSGIFGLFAKIISGLESIYTKFLTLCLSKRKTVLLVTSILVVLTAFSLKFIKIEFLPSTDEGKVDVSVKAPIGTILDETTKITNSVLVALETKKYIESISYTIGGSGGDMFGSNSSESSNIHLSLVPESDRQLSTAEISLELNKELSNIAGAEISVSAAGGAMGNFSSGATDVMIYGSDINELQNISEDIANLMIEKLPELAPGVGNITNSNQSKTPQSTIIIDRFKASRYGVASATITSTIKSHITGNVATKYKTNGTELDVIVSYGTDTINYIPDLENILIPTTKGTYVPLSTLATIVDTEQPATISRGNQERLTSISIESGTASLGAVTAGVQKIIDNYDMHKDYHWKFSGTADQLNTAFKDLAIALVIALLLVYMIMAGQFESFIYPLVVMFSIPIAVTSGLFGILVMNDALSITSFLGIIMLSGIVINNAIVLIDYINITLKQQKGITMRNAIIKACSTRLRPVLMTSITTILGLVPMMFASGGGALIKGLAIVVVFGLSVSTLITLILIPVIYLIIENMKEKNYNKRKNKTLKTQEV